MPVCASTSASIDRRGGNVSISRILTIQLYLFSATSSELDDETAELDQVPCEFAALDLPGSHVMLGPCGLMPMAGCPVALECYQCPDQIIERSGVAVVIPVIGLRKRWLRASPMPPVW